MALVTSNDILSIAKPIRLLGGHWLAKKVLRWLALDKANKLYDALIHSKVKDYEALQKILDTLPVHYQINANALSAIPATGPFITISNHPFGSIDGIILAHAIAKVRPDYKLVVNFLLNKIEPINSYFIPVNPFEEHKDKFNSTSGIRNTISHVRNGGGLGLFPAGEVSSFSLKTLTISDIEWPDQIIKLVKSLKVPVIPIYFEGRNSKRFYLLGLLHPRLRTARLANEMFNKVNKTLRLQVGKQISVETQAIFTDLQEYKHFLRSKLYAQKLALTSNQEPKHVSTKPAEEIIAPIPVDELLTELVSLESSQLFKLKEYTVYCAPTSAMPKLMTEIGRLREITYREVGEGTNKSIDIDKFDAHYHQMFIWNETDKRIVGAYRIGYGRELLQINGLKSFYINSLFQIKRPLEPLMNDAIELGRSFVVKEYQRKATPLFLLWKALFVILVKDDYRYLIGPVSISGKFSDTAKALVTVFLRKNYFNEAFAQHIKNRVKKGFEVPNEIDIETFLRITNKDFAKLDAFIQDFDPQYTTPILVRQYISLLKTEIIGFNIDPDFNYCLDALMLMDIKGTPKAFMESLSKDLKDLSKVESLLSELE
jgi:putative hemolysin